MLVEGSGECLGKLCWLSTWVSTNGGQKGPTGAYEMTSDVASELRICHHSILQRNTGKNF